MQYKLMFMTCKKSYEMNSKQFEQRLAFSSEWLDIKACCNVCCITRIIWAFPLISDNSKAMVCTIYNQKTYFVLVCTFIPCIDVLPCTFKSFWIYVNNVNNFVTYMCSETYFSNFQKCCITNLIRILKYSLAISKCNGWEMSYILDIACRRPNRYSL